MKVENVPAFIERFEEFVSQNILPEQTCAVIDINARLISETSLRNSSAT